MERRVLILSAGAFFAVLLAGVFFQPGLLGRGQAASGDAGAATAAIQESTPGSGDFAFSGYDDDEYEDDDRHESGRDDDDDHEDDGHEDARREDDD